MINSQNRRRSRFRPRTGPSGTPPDGPGNPTVDSTASVGATTRPSRRRTRTRGCIGRARDATLAYLGYVLFDNRHGLVANVCVTAATGTAKRDVAAGMKAASAPPGSTLRADKGYNRARFVDGVRALEVTPHSVQKIRYSAIDGPDHPAIRLPGQPTEAEVGRADLRLAEDGWRTAEAPPSRRGARRLDPDPRRRRLQPPANADIGDDVSLTASLNGCGLFPGTWWQPVPPSGCRHS